MRSKYYSIMLFVEKHPDIICSQDILDMADEISALIGCEYDHLGYTLLDPDYDYKDLGTMMRNTKANREIFLKMSIPSRIFGKDETLPDAPFVFFERKSKDDNAFPPYRIQLEYPINDAAYLSVQIDIKEDLIKVPVSMGVVGKIHDILASRGYDTASSFVDYYRGDSRRGVLNGGEFGIITINDWRVIDHAIKFRQLWKNRVLDVFWINAFDKKWISSNSLDKIVRIVGKENMIEHGGKIVFQLPQSPATYLINRYLSSKSRKEIKRILLEEKVCCKDASLIASILRL